MVKIRTRDEKRREMVKAKAVRRAETIKRLHERPNTHKIKKCAICGREFELRSYNQKYCDKQLAEKKGGQRLF